MSSSLEDALKSTRYNEAVILTVPGNDTGEENTPCSFHHILVATLDEENGGIMWRDAASLPIPNLDIEILRHLRTKKWVVPMLNDARRNSLYNSAIMEACKGIKMNKANKCLNVEGEVLRVLDIGSGTGLLAMLASRHAMNTSQKIEVTSVEMSSAMAKIARITIESNNLQDKIQIVEGHSCDPSFNPYPLPGHKADLCTCELLDSELLGEGILPAIRDAWDRHLCDDASIVPKRARVYAQVLEGLELTNLYGPHRPTDTNSGKYVRLCTNKNNDMLLGGIGVTVPIHSEALFEPSQDSDFILGKGPTNTDELKKVKVLSTPSLVMNFDFTSRESLPPLDGRSFSQEITAVEYGTAHAVLFWWELDIGEGENMTYSTKFGEEPWQDHWQQCLFVIVKDDNDYAYLEKDKTFCLVSSHDETSISFQIHNKDYINNDVNTCPLSKRQRVPEKCTKAIQKFEPIPTTRLLATNRYISPQRALQLNDKTRIETLSLAIRAALKCKGQSCTVLDVSDFCIGAMIAAVVEGANKVISLESSTGGIPLLSGMTAQLGNNLPIQSGKQKADFQIIQSHPEGLTCDSLFGNKVDLVIAEPYYEVLEGWHLQEALNFYYLVKSMKNRGVIQADAISIPSYASVMGCAIEFDTPFMQAYKGLGNRKTVCGFLHDTVDFYGNQNHRFPSIFPLRFYKWKRMSQNFEVARIVYEGDAKSMEIKGNGEWEISKFSNTGTCHAFISWIDYGVQVGGGKFSTFTTGNNYHHQMVYIMSNAVIIKDSDIEEKRFCIKSSFGGLSGCEDHNFQLKVEATVNLTSPSNEYES